MIVQNICDLFIWPWVIDQHWRHMVGKEIGRWLGLNAYSP